ncbi:hypothetical protein HYX12_02790 [Candidatus Woesearchaeota archaeon]|nr:hypothetical protein [Candidatus Woesearchaeota archaeon]
MKRRTVLKILAGAGAYFLAGGAMAEAIHGASTASREESLEQRIAQLFITGSDNFGSYLPGGILLSKDQTRRRIRKRVWEYDPAKTKESVSAILEKAAKFQRKVLIYDEGEGGLVQRIGSLPAAEDIGRYYSSNVVAESLIGRVAPSESKQERMLEVERLFKEYAVELSSQGVNAVLAPNLDLSPDKQNIIGRDKRSFGNYEDTLAIASRYIQVMHETGIKVTGKHFLAAGLPKGDVHSQEVVQSSNRLSKLLSGRLFHELRLSLDAVMVTHIGNDLDGNKPYSLSQRSLQYLTQEVYTGSKGSMWGIHFPGLVMVDDVSMRAFTSYAEKTTLRPELEEIKRNCGSLEGKGVLASLEAGAHVFICLGAPLDPIVDCLARAYHSDEGIREKIDVALGKYESFVGHQ